MDDPSSWRGLLKEFMEEGKLLPCPFLEIYGQEKFLILMKSDFKKKKRLAPELISVANLLFSPLFLLPKAAWYSCECHWLPCGTPPQHGLMSGAMSAPRIWTGETPGHQAEGANSVGHGAGPQTTFKISMSLQNPLKDKKFVIYVRLLIVNILVLGRLNLCSWAVSSCYMHTL